MRIRGSSAYKISDHFDGRHFFNPTDPQGQSVGRIIKYLVTQRPSRWPREVHNDRKLDLDKPLAANEVAVTFVNHATVLIQVLGTVILTDPVWSERVSPVSLAGPKRVRRPGIEMSELPKINFVVVSHNHYDHMDLPTLKELNERFSPTFLVPLGNRRKLENLGAKQVIELDWWQTLPVSSDLEFVFTPTQHFSGRSPFTFRKSLWGSYVIKSMGHMIYFGGDAAYSTHYAEIARRLGAMDLSFLPIGAYEPRWFMKSVHMNPAEAVQAHLDINSKKSIGIHFGTFQLTEEKIDQPVIDLEKAMRSRGVEQADFSTLREGQTRIFLLGAEPSEEQSL